MRPMITNGGPHPHDKWADVTTDTIVELIQVPDDSDTPEAAAARQAKRDLRPKLFDIFNGHHAGVQEAERAKAVSLKAALDPSPHTDKIMLEVDQALAATPFADHFAKKEVRDVIHAIVSQHTADVMHIERRYHADRAATKGN